MLSRSFLSSLLRRSSLLAVVASFTPLILPSPAHASQRHFTYTHGSSVLGAGEAELEPWTTIRVGREDYYLRFDERIEFEVGVTHRLQSAWYLNFTGIQQETAAGTQRTLNFRGVSWEWKFKLLDPVADPVGLGLYLEASAGPGEAEIEGKVLLDKQVGRLLLAFNVVGEVEWEFEGGETARKGILELDLGLAFLASPHFSVGLEIRSFNQFPAGEGWAHSMLSAGPTLMYSQKKWWAAFTILPQIADLAGDTGGEGSESHLDLVTQERVQARVLFGIDL